MVLSYFYVHRVVTQNPLRIFIVVIDVNVSHALKVVQLEEPCVVSPRPEAHLTRLFVKGEVGEVNVTGDLEDGGGYPVDDAVVGEDRP